MVDKKDEINRIMEGIENLDSRDQVERALEEEHEKHVFSNKNIYRGFVNASMGNVTSEEPFIIVYDHSPGFNEGERGYGRIRGVGDTGYLPLEVQSSDTLPDPRYEDSGYLELAVEHDNITVEEDQLATLNVVPYDPEKLTSNSWRDVLDSYDSSQSNIRHVDLT